MLQTSSNNKDIEKYKNLFPENQTTVKGPRKSTGINTNIIDANSAEHTLLKNGLPHEENQTRDSLKSLQCLTNWQPSQRYFQRAQICPDTGDR